MKLSPAQQQVVDHRGGDLQVIACAGSGKTESISRRVAALIAEGAEPASIVAFTFTERAASELKERIVRRVSEVKGPAFRDRLSPMFVGTIHAYCFRLLQDHVPEYGNYDILDEHRHAGLLSREYRALGLSKIGTKHWQPIRDFAKTVDVLGNELIDPAALDGTPLGECVTAYREMLERFHLLTFSSIISTAVEALEDPAIFERVHGPLRHLLVDEYQDINPAQERLIELLATAPVHLCVVGDDDQSIYQWRGSEIRNILEFATRRSNVKSVVLDENRRSRPEIVRTANQFADTIPDRLPKTMSPTRSASEHEVVPWCAETDEEEATRIAETIASLHEQGYRYRDTAVLFRSVRTAAPPLLAALEANDIPFNCGGRTGLFLQPEISLLGEIFAWFVDGEWKDERYGERRVADVARVIEGLCRHFPTGPTAKDLGEYLVDWKKYQLRGTRTVDLIDDLYRLLAQLGAHKLDVDNAVDAARLGAYARFSALLADFEGVHRRGRKTTDGGKISFHAGRDRGKPYFQALHNYLLHYARDAYEDFAGEPDAELDAVDVLTVHQAKGLEWPIVFLPSLVKGRFPSQRAGQAQTWLIPETLFSATTRARYEGGDPEERRLFYVATTRARDALYLSHFRKKLRGFSRSPYLDELLDGPSPEPITLPLPGPPETSAQKEPPPLEIAFSDLARVEDCGHAYRLGNGFGFEQSLAPELGYGRAVHHVLRHVAERVQAEGRLPTAKELDALVDEEMYVPFATGPAYVAMRTSALRLVKRYVADHADDLHRIWAVERPFALHFDDGVVTGRADVILDREGGREDSLAIVDYKVAHDPARDERYRLQLAVYSAAGRGEGLSVDAAYLHELRDGARVTVDVGPAASTAATDRVENLLRKTRAGYLPPRPAADRCAACNFRRICKHAESR
jgi:DNA helicase-2/ATP-dependent DNA helicase PcrA